MRRFEAPTIETYSAEALRSIIEANAAPSSCPQTYTCYFCNPVQGPCSSK